MAELLILLQFGRNLDSDLLRCLRVSDQICVRCPLWVILPICNRRIPYISPMVPWKTMIHLSKRNLSAGRIVFGSASCRFIRLEVRIYVPQSGWKFVVRNGTRVSPLSGFPACFQAFLLALRFECLNKAGLKRCVAIIEVHVVHGNGLFVLFMMHESVNYIEIWGG